MTDDFNWTEFESDSMSFDNVGDKIAGRIKKIEVKQGQSGTYPQLALQVDQDGTEKLVNASPKDLKQQLAALAPQVGWWVELELVGLKHTGQPQPMKLFTVNARAPKNPEPEEELI